MAAKIIDGAYTIKNIKSDDLECTMINELNVEIHVIDENDMKEFINLNAGLTPFQTWAKGLELEKVLLKNTSEQC